MIPFADLDFNFGERWIPTGVFAAYMSHLYETEVKIVYSPSLDGGSGTQRQRDLMHALRTHYPDSRFRPLVVLHEIEALVLAAIDAGQGDDRIFVHTYGCLLHRG